jgi:hypothetical protein
MVWPPELSYWLFEQPLASKQFHVDWCALLVVKTSAYTPRAHVQAADSELSIGWLGLRECQESMSSY